MQQHLPAILAAQKDNYIYHEIGELSDATFDPKTWRELIAAFPHSPVELLARALKDLLADTHPSGTLHHLIENQKFAGLGFYAAFLDGMLKELFPQLREAFIQFTQTGNWRIINDATTKGHQHAKNVAAEMIELYQTGKNKNQLQWAKEQIERVGNIMIDSLEMMRPKIEKEKTRKKYELEKKDYGLVTLHRPSNVDHREIFTALGDFLTYEVAHDMPHVRYSQ